MSAQQEKRTLAQVIRVRRAELDMPQAQLAIATGSSQATISRIEEGQSYPDARLLVLLARALRLRSQDLLDAVEAELPKVAA